jgi:hypothetical protein
LAAALVALLSLRGPRPPLLQHYCPACFGTRGAQTRHGGRSESPGLEAHFALRSKLRMPSRFFLEHGLTDNSIRMGPPEIFHPNTEGNYGNFRVHAGSGTVSSRLEVSWVMCPSGAPLAPRPSHRARTQNGRQTRKGSTQIDPQAPRRCAGGPWRGKGLLGAKSRG